MHAQLRRVEIELKNWRPEHDGLKILFVSDFHFRPAWLGTKHAQGLRERLSTAAAEADIILIGGDFITSKGDPPTYNQEQLEEALSVLKAPLGTYAILGNHDYGKKMLMVAKALENTNIGILHNSSLAIESNGASFQLVGVGFPLKNCLDWSMALLSMKQDTPSILLSHTPEIFSEVPTCFELTLAGHSHGGQLRLPLFGSTWLRFWRVRDFYDMGLFQEGDRQLYVSSGIGTSNYNLRVNCPPEMTLLTLRRAK